MVNMASEPDRQLAKTLSTTILPAPPSCIEFSPVFRDVFVVGTYSLNEGDSHQDTGTVILEEAGHETQTTQSTQSRSGILLVFRLLGDGSVQSIPIDNPAVHTCSAVLDLHFSPHNRSLLAVATSTGVIELYNLGPPSDIDDHKNPRLELLQILQCFSPSTLVLSLAWCPYVITAPTSGGEDGGQPENARAPLVLAATLSTGVVGILEVDPSTPQNVETTPTESIILKLLDGHSLEAWTAAWSTLSSPNKLTLFSGGDDSALATFNINTNSLRDKSIEIRQHYPRSTNLAGGLASPLEIGEAEGEEHIIIPVPPSFPVEYSTKSKSNANSDDAISSFDARIHTAGVTAILPLSFSPIATQPSTQLSPAKSCSVLITGSYDEHIRILSSSSNASSHKKATLLGEKRVGGGVWRLKLMDYKGGHHHVWRILASCMHAGAKVLEVAFSPASNSSFEDLNVGNGSWEVSVVTSFEEHDSMCYACDCTAAFADDMVQPTGGSAQHSTIVSTSFYDKRLCVWNIGN